MRRLLIVLGVNVIAALTIAAAYFAAWLTDYDNN
jgi:hypothetical protein